MKSGLFVFVHGRKRRISDRLIRCCERFKIIIAFVTVAASFSHRVAGFERLCQARRRTIVLFRKGFCFYLCRVGQHFPFHLIRPLLQSGRATDNFGFIWCCPYLSTIKYFTRKGSKSGNLLPVSLPKCKFYFPIRPLPELDLAKVYRTYQHREKILSSCRASFLRWNLLPLKAIFF